MPEAYGLLKLTDLRDRLALNGMDRKQIGDLIDLLTQNSPNTTLFRTYQVEEAARQLRWSQGDQLRVMSAAVRSAS